LHAAAILVKGFTDPLDLASVTAVSANPSLFRRAFLMWECATAPNAVYQQGFGNLLRIESEGRLKVELGLEEPGVATVYVADWVLSPVLANAWAKATHAGLESVNHPEGWADEGEVSDAG
jgi:hypothetical protein